MSGRVGNVTEEIERSGGGGSFGLQAEVFSSSEPLARAVGAAVGSNPLPIVVPYHRVVGKSGSLTGFGGGLPAKKLLLELEERTSVRVG